METPEGEVPQQQPVSPQGDATVSSGNKPMILYILFLAGFVIPLTPIVALIMAYMSKSDAPEWEKTHYIMIIRTFWIGLLYWFISVILTFVLIGFLTMLATAVWQLVRLIKGLMAYNEKKPYENYQTWWF